MTKLPSVTISGLHLSDLFFNSKLLNYNYATICCGTPDEYSKLVSDGLFLDAIEFCNALGLDNTTLPDALVKDFLARL